MKRMSSSEVTSQLKRPASCSTDGTTKSDDNDKCLEVSCDLAAEQAFSLTGSHNLHHHVTSPLPPSCCSLLRRSQDSPRGKRWPYSLCTAARDTTGYRSSE